MNNIINNLSLMEINSKGIIYTRSSTKKQNDLITNSHSLEIQTSNCSKFCFENNIDIIKIETEIVSARNSKKQNVLLNIINTNKDILLLVFDISRFSRNIFDGMNMLQKCMNNNITLYLLKENMYVRDLNDITRFNNLLSNAHAESDAISFRVKKSIEFRKSNGVFLGKRKFGFDVITDNNNKKLKINENEQKTIELILILKFGGLKNKIDDLITFLINDKLKIDMSDIILFGNYENSDIAYFLNFHNIIHKNKEWTTQNVNSIINLNNDKIKKREELTEEFLDEFLIKNKYNEATLKQLFFEINGYHLQSKYLINYNKLKGKCIKGDKLNFLNDINLNYKIWNYEDIESYYKFTRCLN
jgi:DNA invertase Pin-like site-specific DNA recombinase